MQPSFCLQWRTQANSKRGASDQCYTKLTSVGSHPDTSFDNCDRSSDPSQKTLLRWWSQAFVSSRLDYCNNLLCGIAGNLLQKLQSVQFAAARLITGTGRRKRITPVLRERHWLPGRQRIDFKLAVLVHNALHGQLPQYLAESCQLLTDIGRRSLRSADVLTCATKRIRTRLGDRSFSVAGPCLWNSLPVASRDRDISLVQFKRLLKTLWFV